MRILLPENIQESIIKKAIRKAGSERRLEMRIGIPKSSIYDYLKNNRTLSRPRFEILLEFLGLDKNAYADEASFLPENWGRSKGGKACVEQKKKNGTFESQLESARRKAGDYLRSWHESLKMRDPQKYYRIQHERFKLSGLDKCITKRGENVRNTLEKNIADFLFLCGVDYEYEPHIEIDGKSYFPDFKVSNVLIECTMWKNESKAIALHEKIMAFETKNYEVLVFVPANLRDLYKPINSYVISDLDELKALVCPGSSATIQTPVV